VTARGWRIDGKELAARGAVVLLLTSARSGSGFGSVSRNPVVAHTLGRAAAGSLLAVRTISAGVDRGYVCEGLVCCVGMGWRLVSRSGSCWWWM
jgi:hypothetical protein